MHPAIDAALLALFAVHLAVFVRLGLRRREPYYLALVVLFSLLTTVFALRLFAPELAVAGRPLHESLRLAAWAAAAVSLTWTVTRIVRRSRAKTP